MKTVDAMTDDYAVVPLIDPATARTTTGASA
jgi:hypothetical protein